MTPDHNTPTATDGIAFLKGHGTLNDFVILPDDHAELDLDEARQRGSALSLVPRRPPRGLEPGV